MTEKRLAMTMSSIAVLYTLIPMLINASGAGEWITPAPGLTFLVYQLAAFTCVIFGAKSLREGKLLQSFAGLGAAGFWLFLI